MRVNTSDAAVAAADRAGLTLRPAAPDDAEAIAALWHGGWADGHLGHVPKALLEHRGLDSFRGRVPPRLHRTTVATIGGDVVGFLIVHDDEVEQVYVAREARGGGAAGALLTHAEQEVAAGSDVAWLAVAAGNARACRFYERNGWHDAGGFDYAAEIAGGTMAVPCRRYEQQVGHARVPGGRR
jgi:ribosomal protein S18 acetylase RimI-like enzyme